MIKKIQIFLCMYLFFPVGYAAEVKSGWEYKVVLHSIDMCTDIFFAELVDSIRSEALKKRISEEDLRLDLINHALYLEPTFRIACGCVQTFIITKFSKEEFVNVAVDVKEVMKDPVCTKAIKDASSAIGAIDFHWER